MEPLERRDLLAADFLITEFVASNDSSYLDDNGNASDWIEIYNAGTSSGNLAGYSLTDNAGETDKWVFPSVDLDSGDFLIVIAGDDANPGSGSQFYTGFALKASGEYLGLYDSSGQVLSEYSAAGADYPSQSTDVSYGLSFEAGSLVSPEIVGFLTSTTPGFANSAVAIQGQVANVAADIPGGFFNQPVQVSLSTDTAGATVRYTLDGSSPVGRDALVYDGPITISSTTVLRTLGRQDNFRSSFERAYTFLFLDDLLDANSPTGQVSADPSVPPLGFPASWGDNAVDYGIDPDVFAIEGNGNTAAGVQAVKEALLAVPTWSISTDQANLFDSATGIYANASEDGRDWERPSSLQILNPDGSEGVQVNAGLRIRGGVSRRDSNPRHSFRLFFREDYGDSKLNYDVFGDTGTSEFDKLDLRVGQSFSWHDQGRGGTQYTNFIQDVISRYSQRDQDQPYTRSSWVHLYLNGAYWGLYQTQERAEARFAETYLGGDQSDYDVIKPDTSVGRRNQATDGDLNAYNRLRAATAARAADGVTPAFVDNAAYYAVQGLNPDGTRNPASEKLVDVDNLIAYMLEIYASGQIDGPINTFSGGVSGGQNRLVLNNYFAIYNRNDPDGFKFFAHDTEFGRLLIGEDKVGPFPQAQMLSNVDYFNPQTLHEQLMANEEYRLRVADQVQATFFNGGPLSAEALIEKVDLEVDKIDQAIIAESARWGDRQSSTPRTRATWLDTIDYLRNTYLPARNAVVLAQFENSNLLLDNGSGTFNVAVDAPHYPSLAPPLFAVDSTLQHGGQVAEGAALSFSAAGTVYYTTDGSDPRLLGGAVNPTADSYLPNQIITTTTAIAEQAVWKYNDTGTNLGTAWRATGFDDSSWASGAAELGFGDGDESTTVSFGGDGAQKHWTTYFRREFEVPEGGILDAQWRVRRDDGIAVYINGVEVVEARDNLPNVSTIAAGGITYSTPASDVAEQSAGEWLTFTIPASYFTAGTNVIATEVHQINQTSSDLSFAGELKLTQVVEARLPVSLQNFDGVTPPALPVGWTAENVTGSNAWTTVSGNASSSPNRITVSNPSTVSDSRLTSPTIAVTAANDRLRFANSYETENIYDGGVLEISIAGAPFQDILAAGGEFVSGGYNGTISTGFNSPLSGRAAWTGNSNGFVTTEVQLPTAAHGNNAQLQWRFGSDSSASVNGWSIDSIEQLVETTGNTPPLVINATTRVKARTLASDGTWSALQIGQFFVNPIAQATADHLRISEIHYNPADDGLEFIELFNPTSDSAAVTIDLSRAILTGGPSVPLVLPANRFLAPGEYGLLVADREAFLAAHPEVEPRLVLGEWGIGGLSNAGERLRLKNSAGDTIADVTYDDNALWPKAADGVGASLVLVDPSNTPTAQVDKPFSWRASAEFGGTPGAASAPLAGVVINEVLSHTDSPATDAIELLNTTLATIDIGGWYLSDSDNNLQKYQIPSGTLLAAGEYVVFDETDFNATTAGFGLNAAEGDQVFLTTGDASNQFVDEVSFGAAFNGQSFGRLPNGSGRLAPLAATTLGTNNGTHLLSPVLISEVNYHPAEPTAAALAIEADLTDNDLEFIELYNRTSQTVDLTDWQIRGEADFNFATGTMLDDNDTIVIVTFDPEDTENANRLLAFKDHYGLGSDVTIVGGLSNRLSNGYGRIELQRPDAPPLDDLTLTPHVTADELVYDDFAPWAVTADGGGDTLQRTSVTSFAGDAASWQGNLPTPGSVVFSGALAGDYNDNGVVDLADYTVWRDQLGQSVTLVNESLQTTPGEVTTEDYAVWKANYGATQPITVASLASERLIERSLPVSPQPEATALTPLNKPTASAEITDQAFAGFIDLGSMRDITRLTNRFSQLGDQTSQASSLGETELRYQASFDQLAEQVAMSESELIELIWTSEENSTGPHPTDVAVDVSLLDTIDPGAETSFSTKQVFSR